MIQNDLMQRVITQMNKMVDHLEQPAGKSLLLETFEINVPLFGDLERRIAIESVTPWLESNQFVSKIEHGRVFGAAPRPVWFLRAVSAKVLAHCLGVQCSSTPTSSQQSINSYHRIDQ